MLRKYGTSFIASALVIGSASASNAAFVGFATLGGSAPGNVFSYSAKAPPQTSIFTVSQGTNIGTKANPIYETLVNFTYDDLLSGAIGGAHPVTGTPYSAYLTLYVTATQGLAAPGLTTIGNNNIDSLKFTITALASDGDGVGGKILLSGTAGTATPGVPAADTGLGGVLTASTSNSSNKDSAISGSDATDSSAPAFVTFSSQVINTNGLTEDSYGFTFSSDSPNNSYHGGTGFGPKYLNSFTTGVVGGTFSADSPVPEPGMLSMLGGALVSASVIAFRRRRK